MILASVPWLLRPQVAREDDEPHKGLTLVLYIAMLNTTKMKTTHEIVRARNIGLNILPGQIWPVQWPVGTGKLQPNAKCDITRMSHHKTTPPEPYDFYLVPSNCN
jgi:hypothetical protein